LEILWAFFARTQIKSLSTDERTTESKVKQESEEKNEVFISKGLKDLNSPLVHQLGT